jgi:hypothetical protein
MSLIFFLITLISLIFSILGIFLAHKFNNSNLEYVWNEIPEKIYGKYYFVKKYTYPFYFTIQSNFLALFYFLLIFLNKINPRKNKKSLIFEGIVLINLIVTVIIYWTLIAPFLNLLSNYYLFIENILLHAIVPSLFFIFFIYRLFILKNQKCFIEYKEFWKFLIYPIFYLIISILLYYITRIDYVYVKKYTFINEKLATKFKILLIHQINDINFKLISKSVFLYTPGIWGNAVYYFFNFDNIIWWLSFVIILAIFILFLILIFIYIKITKKSFKFKNNL